MWWLRNLGCFGFVAHPFNERSSQSLQHWRSPNNPLKGLAQTSLLFTTCCLEVVMWHHLTARGNVGQPVEYLAGISVAAKASHHLYSHCAHLPHCPPSPGHTGSSTRLCRRWSDQITIDNVLLPRRWSRWEHLIESLAFRWAKYLNHDKGWPALFCSVAAELAN